MAGDVEVSRRMFTWRLIATPDVATGLTGAEVNPFTLASGEAVFTPLALGDGVGYGVEVLADFQRRILFRSRGRLNAQTAMVRRTVSPSSTLSSMVQSWSPLSSAKTPSVARETSATATLCS